METKEKPKTYLKAKEKLSFLINSLLFQEAMQTIDNYILYFYTDIMLIGAGMAGSIGLVVTIWDAINDPLVGQWTVNHKFKNKESVRPHMLYSCVPWAVFFILIWIAPNMPLGFKVFYAIATRCILSVFTTILQVPQITMPFLASPLQQDRVTMGQLSAVGTLIGVGLGVIGCYPLVALFGGGTNSSGTAVNEPRGFLLVGVLFAVLGIGGLLLYYFNSKERVLDNAPSEKISLLQNFKLVIPNKHWINVTLFNFLIALTDSSILACVTYYCKYIIGNTMYSVYCFGGMLVCGLIGSIFCKPISKRFGGKGIAIGTGIGVVIGEVILIFNPASKALLMICACMHGIKLAFSQTVLPLYRGYVSDIIAHNLNGKRIDGIISTISNFFKKLGYALTSFLIGWGLEIAHYDGSLSVQPASAIAMLKVMMIWMPLVAGIGVLIYACFINVEREAQKLSSEDNN